MKDKETIRKLFITVEEEFYKTLMNNPKYMELLDKRSEKEELLEKTISKEQLKLWDEANSIQNEIEAFGIEEAFIKGFNTSQNIEKEAE